MFNFNNLKNLYFTLLNLIKIFFITYIKSYKKNSTKFFFFYFPVKAYQENIIELGNTITQLKNTEVFFIYNSKTSQEIKFKKNSLFLDFNYFKFIPFINFLLSKINFLITSYVIYTFPPKTKNIYISHDIYDTPMAKTDVEKKIFIELSKIDYIFVSSEIALNYFKKGFSKNIANKLKLKAQVMNTGYLKLDHVHKKLKKIKDKKEHILIAPTSSKLYPNANLSKKLDKMIGFLLKKKMKIIFRPHPLDLTPKGEVKLISSIIRKYRTYNNFEFDISTSYIKSYAKSKLLITDFSGTAYTYAFSNEKPVIFYSSFNKLSFDKKLKQLYYFKDRKKIGYIVNNINSLYNRINRINKNKDILRSSIKDLRKKRIKFFNNSLRITKNTIEKIQKL